MMRPLNSLATVYLCVEPVDFRLQINGLAARVQEVLLLDPLSAQLFGWKMGSVENGENGVRVDLILIFIAFVTI